MSDDYARIVEAARSDDRVVGLVLTGSRGRGAFVRPDSDWDVRLVVRNDALGESEERFATRRGSLVEVVVLSLTDFEQVGAIGSPTEWDRYSYVRAEVVLDKLDGRIRKLVSEKGSLPPAEARRIATQALDAYVNAYYRSAKSIRNGLLAEARLDAAESVPSFVTALFAVHERVRPFNGLLTWELATFPLGDEAWSADRLLPRLDAIAATAAVEEQQSLFRDAEELARSHELGGVIEGWEPDLAWLRGGQAGS